MKTHSAKAKGRRLQDEVQKLLLEHFPMLEEDDLRKAIMGESGADIKMSPLARKMIPYSIEAKNQEKISIWQAWQQAEDNTIPGTSPLLVFKRNRSDILVTLRFSDFLSVIDKNDNS